MTDLSLYDEGAFAPCPTPFNLAAHTLSGGADTPDKSALEILCAPGEVSEHWTYCALTDTIARTAGGLRARGVARGDRVMLRLGNAADFPILFFAANALGAIPVPLSAQLTPAEISAIAADLEPRLVLCGPGLPLPPLPGVEVLDPAAIAALRDSGPLPFAQTAPDDPAFIVYTSGTGGRPKGVVHAQRTGWARRMMWDGWYGLTSSDRVLHAGAFNWTYTLGAGLTDPWAVGATALIYAGPPDRNIWPVLARAHSATIFAAAPGVYRQMLDHPALGSDFAALRHGISAGEALPEAIRAAWSGATGKPIYQALGMSEISTYVSFSPAAPPVPERAGRPQQGRRVAVLSELGTDPVPLGVEGSLAVSTRDPGLMLGYWRRDAETAAAFRGEWFVTGDRARMEHGGTLTYLGRADDVMNAGGYRVSPQEVEAAMLAHPGVADCAAIEQAVRPGVTVIAAHYVPADGPLGQDALARHCAGRLARYKCPKIFVATGALPRGANGKLMRRILRERTRP